MTVLALEVADLARVGESEARPFDLWRLAEKEARGKTERGRAIARRVLFRHAMIHSGFVTEPGKKRPYRVCPDCREALT